MSQRVLGPDAESHGTMTYELNTLGAIDAWQEILHRLQQMANGFFIALPNIIAGVVVFVIFLLLGKAMRMVVAGWTGRHQKHHNIARVLGRLAQGVMFILGILIAAVIVFPNFTPASLIQLLGISSVAIGFAFRDILQNYLAGILLLVTEPFRIGDQIVFGSYEGTVEDIQTRATMMRTYDGRRVVVPNGELFTTAVMVNTAYPHRRIEYDVGIGYGDDIEKAKQLIHGALGRIESVLTDPAPDVLAYDLAGSSVVLRVRWWLEPPRRKDALNSRDEVITQIKKTLVENGIDLPFPTQQVLFHDQTEETDGDRSRQREGWPAGDADAPKPRQIASAIARLNGSNDGRDRG